MNEIVRIASLLIGYRWRR